MRSHACEECGAQLPAARFRRHAKTCGEPCELARDRRRKRERSREAQARIVAARAARVCTVCGRPLPRERHGLATTCETPCAAPQPLRLHRCSRQGCMTITSRANPICVRHLPRFDVEPKPRPVRATYDELVHYTYGGTSIAAQAAETRSEAWVTRQKRAGGGR